MAIYHCSVKKISRTTGRTCTGSAAYRAAEKLIDYQGNIHDYTRKKGVLYNGIVLGNDYPAWALDRENLWNVADEAENRKDSAIAREYEIALPEELNFEEQRILTRQFARYIVDEYGVAADVTIHAPRGDNKNYHAHILTSTRVLTSDGFKDKTRILDCKDTSAIEVKKIRAAWESLHNQALERNGFDESYYVSSESLEAQNIDREPQIHLGVAAAAMARRGIRTERSEHNEKIKIKEANKKAKAEATAAKERAETEAKLEAEAAAAAEAKRIIENEAKEKAEADAREKARLEAEAKAKEEKEIGESKRQQEAIENSLGSMEGSAKKSHKSININVEGFGLMTSTTRKGYTGFFFEVEPRRRFAFVDIGAKLYINSLEDKALLAALKIAQARWGEVAIKGSNEYIRRCAELAAQHNITLILPGESVSKTEPKKSVAPIRPPDPEALKIENTAKPIEELLSDATILRDSGEKIPSVSPSEILRTLVSEYEVVEENFYAAIGFESRDEAYNKLRYVEYKLKELLSANSNLEAEYEALIATRKEIEEWQRLPEISADEKDQASGSGSPISVTAEAKIDAQRDSVDRLQMFVDNLNAWNKHCYESSFLSTFKKIWKNEREQLIDVITPDLNHYFGIDYNKFSGEKDKFIQRAEAMLQLEKGNIEVARKAELDRAKAVEQAEKEKGYAKAREERQKREEELRVRSAENKAQKSQISKSKSRFD